MSRRDGAQQLRHGYVAVKEAEKAVVRLQGQRRLANERKREYEAALARVARAEELLAQARQQLQQHADQRPSAYIAEKLAAIDAAAAKDHETYWHDEYERDRQSQPPTQVEWRRKLREWERQQDGEA